MALPTAPRTQGGDPQADFLRDVMGVGAPAQEHDSGQDEGSVFAETTTIDEILEVFEENETIVREREEEKTWQDLQPRVQEYADKKVVLWVFLTIAVVAAAIFGAWALVNHLQPTSEPVVIQQDSGYQVPVELLDE